MAFSHFRSNNKLGFWQIARINRLGFSYIMDLSTYDKFSCCLWFWYAMHLFWINRTGVRKKNRLACASSHHPFFAPSFLRRMVQIHTIVNNPSNYIASLIKPNNFYHTPDDYHHLEIYNEKGAHAQMRQTNTIVSKKQSVSKSLGHFHC